MRKIITYGTFDLFHKGHYNILKRAKENGDYLVVGVTGESYDIERGKLNVRDSLLTRIRNVEQTGFADKIIVEEYQGQKINDIRKYDIDALVIGSDWRGKFDYLMEYCEVIYLERTKNISSTQIRESGRTFNVGLATSDASDHQLAEEALYVSGVHVRSAYSPSASVLEQLQERFELESFFTDYDAFLESVDVVYIKTDFELRCGLVERAVAAGKHVIVEPPFLMSAEDAERIFALAAEKGVVVTERLMLAYLRAFTQLIWFLHGGIVGDITNIRLVMGGEDFEGAPLNKMQYESLYAALKVLNETAVEGCNSFLVEKPEGVFNSINLVYGDKMASIELSTATEPDCGLQIFGTRGTIRVPDDWWHMGYFEVCTEGDRHPKRYSFNYEGNGFRYLLQDLQISVDLGRCETTKLPFEDMNLLVEAFSQIQ